MCSSDLFNTGTYEKRFAQEQMERFGLREKKELTARGRELDKAKQRVSEIDQLIQKSYEDMIKQIREEKKRKLPEKTEYAQMTLAEFGIGMGQVR